MYFIDTHCHLENEVFEPDRLEILERCAEKKVKRFIIPGLNVSQWDRMLRVCSQKSGIFAAPGFHPSFLPSKPVEQISALTQFVQCHRDLVVAIGECGLDLYNKSDDFELQKEFFILQIDAAKRLKLPLILHVRKAHDQALKLLKEKKTTNGGIVHCYSGSERQASHYVDLGFKLGIGGVVTYERSKRLHRIASNLPLSAFVLETDAPDIPISGRQNTRNSPEFIPEIFKAFVKFRSESEKSIMDKLYFNALELFPKIISS